MNFFLKRAASMPPRRVRVAGAAVLAIAGAVSLQVSLVGCGMAAGPQPPSLQLPRQIPDLTANRTGDQVSLHWTTPRENTDRLKLQGRVRLRICRQQQTAPCDTVTIITAAPGQPAQYTDDLPAACTTGPLRPLRYSIFGINKHGRTAGPSNTAMALAGAAPPQVQNLSLQVVERGVLLHWQPVPHLPLGTSVEIERTLATSAAANAKPVKTGNPNLLPPAEEPVQQTLRVTISAAGGQTTEPTEEIDPGIALDSSALFGRQYSYTVRRVIELQADNRTLTVAGPPSASATIVTRDTFPPGAPVALSAVPVSASMNHGVPEVDLSWSANTEPDLAQYRIYRQDVTLNESMQRIAPANDAGPIVAPAFRDLHVQSGHTYAYAVSAVDAAGNESPQSPKIQITVPAS